MSEIITIQVGQCGNQIGWKFWENALIEHVTYNKKNPDDLSFRSFFEITEKGSFSNPENVRARALLVDSETNVTEQLHHSRIGSIFRGSSVSVDEGGAGNNWAVGYLQNGEKRIGDVMNRVRVLAEKCNHLESVFMLYSLGGGTGSGFGSLILEQIACDYPKLWKMATVVTPTDDDPNVVTAPYNTIMSCSHLCQYADCVFPIENDSLTKFVSGVEDNTKGAFDQMNNVVANFLLDMTAGSRFSGKLNVDLTEIPTNMIPFKNHKFIVSGHSPVLVNNPPRSISGYFSEAMSPKGALCNVDLSKGTYISSALLLRGDIPESSIHESANKLATTMKFPIWNTEHWKIGLCSNKPPYAPYSICSLANTSAIEKMFGTILERYGKLAGRGAYLHNYINAGLEVSAMRTAADCIQFFQNEYITMNSDEYVNPRPTIIV